MRISQPRQAPPEHDADLPVPGHVGGGEADAVPQRPPAYRLALSAIMLWWAVLTFAWLFQRAVLPALRDVGGHESFMAARVTAAVTSPEPWFSALLAIAAVMGAVALLSLARWESPHRTKAFVGLICLFGFSLLWLVLSFVGPVLRIVGSLEAG